LYALEILGFLEICVMCGRKKKNVQIIKRKYIMTNINTQKTDYSVYYHINFSYIP